MSAPIFKAEQNTLLYTQEAGPTDQSTQTLRLKSAALLQGMRKIIIDHDGTAYTLQLTRQNKLLLTK